ncbi:MAG: hypothetical protein IJJ26_05275 [Victivallales bacterium]|nr:hypothetical protein [Victivallales bacterium]
MSENAATSGKKSWKKWLWSGLTILVLILIIVFAFVVMFLDSIIKTGIEQVGSKVTKCDIKVQDVSISLLRGKVKITNLVVGNPEGFKTESAFSLGLVSVDMDMGTIFSDKLVIEDITVMAPEITYELAPLKLTSNLGQIQKNVEDFLPANEDDKDEKKEKKEKEEKPGKKVVINHVLVQDGKIRLSATIAQGHALPVPLPKVEMNDIGKEKEVTTAEATASVLSKTLGSAIDVAKNALKSLGSGISEGTKKVVEGTKDLVKGVFGGKDKDETKTDAKELKEEAKKVAKDAEKDVKQAAKEVKEAAKEAKKDVKEAAKGFKDMFKK